MTSTSLPDPAPAVDAPHRRFFEAPQSVRRLEWDEEGTPLPPSSVVYLFRSHDKDFPLWDLIKTQERLQLVREAPEQFELWTLFTVPVDDLVRAPVTIIADALRRKDRIEMACEKAISGMREVARETAARP